MNLAPLLITLTTFSTLMAQDPPRIVIAHRGASGYLPEHTLEAKAMAHAQGAHYLEQDLVLTRDGVPVVLHDIHIDTVTDVAEKFPDRKGEKGRYYALDFTLAELKTLRVTERFQPLTGKQVYPQRFPKGQGKFEIATLEEELQLIQGLNRSTGRVVGIYPEIKQPAWHLGKGHDLSAVVLPILHRYGYRTKEDPCYLQCFEHDEVIRLREKLGWQGRLIMLMGGGKTGPGNTDFAHLRTPAGLAELAKIADGIGPDLKSIIAADRQPTALVKDAHASGLKVHPYTFRIDELPKFAKSPEDLLSLLFDQAHIDGLFSDFPDIAVRWVSKP